MRTFHHRLLICCFLLIQAATLLAQNPISLKWYDPAASNYPVLQGRGWQTELESPYDRLPLKAKQQLRPALWSLAGDAAGLSICFKTSATNIVIRYTVKDNQAMPHMPATGVSGLDLYARDIEGGWKWAKGNYRFGDTIEYHFQNLSLSAKEEEFTLYLPLYNKILWMNIGVPAEASFQVFPVNKEQPIVAYGTSIMQGACASRPGMAWTNILERKIDRPVINLGFSGNGLLEQPVLERMNELDAKLFVLDCMPNLIESDKLSASEIHTRILHAVSILQDKHPSVPILLVEHCCGLQAMNMDSALTRKYKAATGQMAKAFLEMQQGGTKNIYLLTDEAMGFDMESTVDGTHPNDIGMMKYAEAYEKSIRAILGEVKGNIRTTQPLRQRRDYATYDFMQRHEAVLKTVIIQKPAVVLMGNSIIHFWGGQPASNRNWGQASWQKYWEPLNTMNLGFGWDRIENVLWRVYHGEIDGFQAKYILLTIGTNNLSIGDSDEEILMGLSHLAKAIQQHQPWARLYISGIYPRRNMEARVERINKGIAGLARSMKIPFVNPGLRLLGTDHRIREGLFVDGLHPNEAGYEILAQALMPYFSKKNVLP